MSAVKGPGRMDPAFMLSAGSSVIGVRLANE
jgi:hypothetical protein